MNPKAEAMINCTDINSAKEAPPKTRRAEPKPSNNFVLNHGYQCARCGDRYTTTSGSRFVMLGGYRRRVCGKCGGVK